MLRVAHPPEHHAFRIRWIFPWFLCMVLIAVVWGLAIHTLTTPKPVAARLHPDAVVWGDRVFANRTLFAHWLHARGLSYEAWAKKHPAGQAIITGRKVPAPAKHPVRRVAAARRAPAPSVVASSATSPVRMILAYFLVALVIAGLAFAPVVTLGAPFLGPRAFRLLGSRVYVAAAAASAAIGLLAARV